MTRDWLKDARTKQRLTMKQMADALGITEAYYSLIESGNRQQKMDVTIAFKLGAILGLSLEDIMTAEAKLFGYETR